MRYQTFSTYPAGLGTVLSGLTARWDFRVVHVTEVMPDNSGQPMQYVTIEVFEKEQDETVQDG